MAKSKINEVEGRVSFPKLEDEISHFWKENQTFKKSVEQRSEERSYSFVDGPPFVSGLPHYGHLLTSVAKDVVPRYWTMKGYKVRRVWGWDCHGLPIEAKVNKEHNLKGHDQIENEFGVDRYIEECRKYVQGNIEEWKWYIDKIGRWVDLDNAYYTMKPEFNESVIWAFKQMWDKGLIYKGKRVSLYSTDTATPVSNFEVAMDTDNYQDTEDLSVFIKFKLKSHPFEKLVKKNPVYMLAWTTTPWTLPSNFALAVNQNFDYVLAKFNNEYFVLARDRVTYAFQTTDDNIGEEADKVVRVLKSFKGDEVDALAYEPLYDFYLSQTTDKDFKVYLLDDVTNEEGTGVLHIAPAFGEVDNTFGNKVGLSEHNDIDAEGNMSVGPWKGKYLRDASPEVAEDLAKKGKLLRSEMYTHRLPYYRGDNPLIYMAQDSYFIDIQSMKKRMLELNEAINWVPDHVKHGRFADTVETSPDWAISRDRYWATVMPLWVSDDGEELVVGSIDEMMEYTDQIVKKVKGDSKIYYLDGKEMSLHRDFCDKVLLKKEGKEFRRVPQVLDCWLDSGSVPFAEYGYPFRNKEMFEKAAPADFIVEYVGQVRAWFNVLHRLSTILFDRPAFKNVICHGTLAGNDGRKMSKTYGNYPDPREVLDNVGAEALRLYFMSTGIMNGGDMNWSDEELNEQVKNVLIPFWNTYRYLTLYANMKEWSPENTEFSKNNILDRWLESYMNKVAEEYATALDNYNLPQSVKLIQPTVDDISTWWIRRSRERFAAGDPEALQTLYAAIVKLTKIFASQMPFLTESVYQNLVVGTSVEGGKESVHLEDYPEGGEVDQKLLDEMDLVRKAASAGLKLREDSHLKLRQPLAKAWVPVENEELQEILKGELNVKEVQYSDKALSGKGYLTTDQSSNVILTLDGNLTDELKEEGLFNEVARLIQDMRKKTGCQVGQKVTVLYKTESKSVKDMMEKYKKQLMQKVDADLIKADSSLEGKEVMLNGENVIVEVKK